MKAVTQLAEKTIWVERGLVSPMQVRRMKDIEFASELLIGVIHGPQGGSAKKIDEFYRQYEEFDDEFPANRLLFRGSTKHSRRYWRWCRRQE